MPLIVVSGYPSSGKSNLSLTLKKYFLEKHMKESIVVSENELVKDRKNVVFRGTLEFVIVII